jgi:hypothetical protein
MMKKPLVILIILVLLSTPVFAQWRIDVGALVPRNVGIAVGGSADVAIEDFPIGDYFIPFPEAGFYYTGTVGPFNLGIGARAFTFIVETVLWPNAIAEVTLGPVVVEAQIGGGIFAIVGLFSDVTSGKVFIPDLSAWFKIGKKGNFRLGGGFIGLYMPELTGTDAIPFLLYLGGKVAIPL